MKIRLLLSLRFLFPFAASLSGESLELFTDLAVPQVDLVVRELELTLGEDIHRAPFGDLPDQQAPVALVLLATDEAKAFAAMQAAGGRAIGEIKPEGFALRQTSRGGKTVLWLIAADPAGLLYGGYEIAEQIRCYGLQKLKEVEQNPYMAMRGTKFNIPLDVRTPSYTDASDAAQKNIGEMWSFDFWKAYIESLARHRYNYISCWSLHPFPSLVKVPGYEEVALDDVQRSTVRWNEHYTPEAIGLDAPAILESVETLRSITMEEKIAFWRKVMAYAKLHNIDFYFVTWNIFTNGTGGKYRITDDADNPVTRDYFRKSVRQMFLTYPDLKGIGLTTGENMHENSFAEKEDWAYETYARGVLDVVQQQPGRKITFIHRQHMAGALEIAEKFKPLIDHPDIEFIYSFKYAKAHVYSSTRQTYHEGFVRDIQDKGNLKTIWTLRNDDVFHFRWGAPDFVREFIENIPYEVSRGYYYGSDQYIWGREFLSLDPEFPREIEIDKHWYQWMLWGRLGYDPALSNERFIRILQSRFPGVDAPTLFAAWQDASMIYPETTGFHWGALDFIWYIEACQGRPRLAHTPTGFHDVNRFITMETHPGTDYISIPDYVEAHTAGRALTGTTPFAVARQIHAHADSALQRLQGLGYGGDKALRQTLDDIRTMAWLGKYYAHKIEGATELALFRATLDRSREEACVAHLNKAATFWRAYASLALSNNRNPLWTNRVGHVDWRETFQSTLYDIRSVGGGLDLPSMEPSPGGTLLEAEAAVSGDPETLSEIPGFTGPGYVRLNRGAKDPSITWSYDASQSGPHMLELRYINHWNRRLDCPIVINGTSDAQLTLWDSGAPRNWVWDRVVVNLEAGHNQIQIVGGGRYYIDHLNIIPLRGSTTFPVD